MATHIVSWGGSNHIISPVNSSESSIISIDSIQTSSAVREARVTESQAKHMSSVLIQTEPSGSETSASTYPRVDAADASFERHQKYFFKDGNVTFLVDGTLYCVHRYFFSRDSEYFSSRFAQLGIHDHESLPITISLGNIERNDFDAFLSILYPENFEQLNLSYKEWRSVLHLSTQWNFASIRRLALNNLQPPTPHDRLLLARTYSVDHWVIPALSALCERSAPLSLEEARQMNIEDVVLVAAVREDIRNQTLRVDTAEIPRRVEAAQAGELDRVDSVEVPSAVPTSGAVEQASSPVAEKQASKDYDTEEVDGKVLVISETPKDFDVGVPVEDSGGVAVRREVEAEDASGTELNAMKEEAARRKAYGEAVRRAEVEEAARRKAHNEAVRRAAEEEAARRRAYGGPSLKGKKKKGLA